MKFDTATPLYYQIVSEIKEKILNGTLHYGDKILPEEKLREIYGVSRVTVRKALEELVEEGLIEKRPSKCHFVCGIKEGDQNINYRSLSKTLRQYGHEVASKIFGLSIKACPLSISKYFGCEPGIPMLEIQRIRYVESKPFVEEIIYIPEDKFFGLNPWELENKSLIDIIINDFGYKIAYSNHTLEAKIPTKDQMKILELKSKKPQVCVHNTMIDDKGAVIAHLEILYIADVFEYSFSWYSTKK